MKIANFARLDPALRKRNIAGAAHGAQAEVEIWSEFNDNWEELSFESERLIRQMTAPQTAPFDEAQLFPEGRTRESIVRTRVNQGFFRAAVLAAYGERCCVTGLSVPQLLTASHIVPWSVDVKNRTNPRNGLCLNATHDRAFDCGLITITPDFKLKISPKAKRHSSDVGSHDLLFRYENASISPPRHFAPEPEFLTYHQEHVFLKS